MSLKETSYRRCNPNRAWRKYKGKNVVPGAGIEPARP